MHPRFADEGQILACVEQYLMMNSSALSQDSTCLRIIEQLLYIYVCAKDQAVSRGIPYSMEAENLLASLTEHCQHDIVSSKMHRNVFAWLLQLESLEGFMVASMMKWFKNFARKEHDFLQSDASLPRASLNKSEDLSFFLVALEEDECCGALLNRLLDEVLASQVEEDIKLVVGHLTRFVKVSALCANHLCLYGMVSNVRSWLAIYGSRLPGVFGHLIELLYQTLCAVDHSMTLDEESWHLLANQSVFTLAEKINGFVEESEQEEMLSLISLMSLILHKSIENTGFLTQASGVIISNDQLQNSVSRFVADAGAQGPKLWNLDPESSYGRRLSCILAFRLLCLRCAIIKLRPSYVHLSLAQPFLQSLEEPLDKSPCTALLPKSYKLVEPLCRMLYFGPIFLKVLSSCCLVESFNWLTQGGKKNADAESDHSNGLSRILHSIVMVLQGSMLDRNEIVRRNSSFCIYCLMMDASLNPSEKEVLYGSPWHHFLLDDFVLTLLAPISANGPSPDCILIAIGLLRLPCPPEWVWSVLSPFSISEIISNLPPERITSATIMFLKELHNKGHLEGKHMETIHKTLQMARQSVYEYDGDGLSLCHDQRHSVCSSGCRQDSDAECLLSDRHIVNLAVSYWMDPLTGRWHHAAEPQHLTAPLALIDEFIQETNSKKCWKS